MVPVKFDAIGFDYGNTLVIDPFDRVMKMKGVDFVRIMEANGYEIDKKKLVGVWAETNRNLNYPHCSHFAQEVPLVRAVLEALDVKKTDRVRLSQQLLVAYRSGLKYTLRNDKQLAQIKETLASLKGKGKKLFIISNEKVDTLDAQLHWTGLNGFFDKIITSKRFGAEKPDPAIFRYAARFFDMPMERVLFVGDDPQKDIKPAKEVGFRAAMLERPKGESVACWRDYNFELQENERPDFVIKQINELVQIVE